jgi:hypothetical protein
VGRARDREARFGGLRLELDRDAPGLSVLLDDHVIGNRLDDVFDLGHDVVVLHDEPRRIGPDVLVLEQGQLDAFRARRVGALAEELVPVRVETV